MKTRKVILSLLAIALIWACGKDEDPAPPKNTAPVIAAQSFATSEDAPDTYVIGTVTATDADGDALTFSMKTNDNDLFAITKVGELSLASGKTLDYEAKQQHTISVAVSDGTASVNATMTITVSKGLAIAAQQFSILESVDAATEIGMVQAFVPGGGTGTFKIEEDASGLFEITTAGLLSLIDGKKMDYDAAQQHTLKVSVSDGINTQSAVITITVMENMDPMVDSQQFTVAEDIVETDAIGTVVASDPEGDALTFSIKTNDNDLFEIDANGELSLVTGMNLDYETAKNHELVVTVSDGTNQVDLTVQVKVTNVVETMFDDPTSFITTWKTETNVEDITFVLFGFNLTIDWGDGQVETNVNIEGFKSHVYEAAGTYTVAIQGDLNQFNTDGLMSTPEKLVGMEQWGTTQWENMAFMFVNAENMVYNATDAPDLTNVTNMSSMFIGAIAFNGDLNNWDVSNVTDLSFMFSGATAFNQDLSGWSDKLGNVTTMRAMFSGATAFNQDLSGWDVSNVTNMHTMFYGATAFNGDLSNWDVINITNMDSMFSGASAFDQSLATWNIGNVTEMSGMLFTCGMGQENLNATLIGWSTPKQGYDPPMSVTLGIHGLTYCGQEAIDAVNTLGQTYGWTFEGNYSVNPVCN